VSAVATVLVTNIVSAAPLLQTQPDTNPSSATSTALQLLAYGASTFLVAAIRRRKWDSDLTAILSAAVIFLVYVAVAAIEGNAWPLTDKFWTGLLAAYGTQQIAYNVLSSPRLGDPLSQVENNT
jgi:peptidoglycan/LPS O-acetylase OafA/YrhL